jgi:predicted TIM-barrel fold metal-dependent hydrolase
MYRLQLALKHFGASRIILGSDTPYGNDNLRLNIERIKSLSISDEDKAQILGLNMRRILGDHCA